MRCRRKIVINASTVLISGGFYLTHSIIQALIDEDIFDLTILCPNRKKYRKLEGKNSQLLVVPQWLLKRRYRFLFDFFWLPAKLRQLKPEQVFSFTNIPARTRMRQIYLHDNPYFLATGIKKFGLSGKEIILQKIRSFFTEQRMKFVDLTIVQSQYYEEKLKTAFGNDLQSVILTPSVSKFMPLYESNTLNNVDKKFKIICLSRYYEHKNLEIFLQVAQKVRSQSLPFCFFITIDKRQHPKAAKLLQQIQDQKLDDILINLGKINYLKTREYIRSCDAMILPSFLESFSLTFIEAWANRKPLFVADTEANRSSCLDAAEFFNPFSEESIIHSLSALESEDKKENLIRKGEFRIRSLSSWNEYVTLVKEFRL
ncbi:MAG: glycosyltransferase [Bacteroidales bacterium]|nr:glycosyltransferase [Bacteroidales bacterium]